jgi:hypothetical protein
MEDQLKQETLKENESQRQVNFGSEKQLTPSKPEIM